MPMGAVSLQTYRKIFDARSFDRYGKIKSNKLSEKEKMIADLQATFANQASAQIEEEGGGKKGSAVEELKTPTWKIGYKKTEYGPPGEKKRGRSERDEDVVAPNTELAKVYSRPWRTRRGGGGRDVYPASNTGAWKVYNPPHSE